MSTTLDFVIPFFSGFSPASLPTDTSKIVWTGIAVDKARTKEKAKVIIPDIQDLLKRIEEIEEEVKSIPKVSR